MSTFSTHKSETFVAKVVFDKARHVNTLEYQSQKFLDFFVTKKLKVGDTVQVKITDKKPKRTEAQNRYLWFYYGLISDETGFTSDEVHAWAKGVCLPSKVKTILGYPVRIKKSTTELTKAEFSEFLNNIQSKTGVPLPETDDPNIPILAGGIVTSTAQTEKAIEDIYKNLPDYGDTMF